MTDGQLVRLVYHEAEPSPGFADWLAGARGSLALTNGNRLFLVGLRPDGSLDVAETQYQGAAALAALGSDAMLLATRYQIWRLQNALGPGRLADPGHDRLYLPQTAWTTGFVDVRDVATGADGSVLFVNGAFSCLATVDERLNFAPRWLPPFVTALAAEDRCHLTGVAMRAGRPAYVTCGARTDTPAGWRDHRRTGGLVLDVPGGTDVASGLSLPNSPVLDGDRLWLANGGAGEVGFVDTRSGTYQPVAAVPGFARGLALWNGAAVVGASKPPREETFDGLVVGERTGGGGAQCGVFVVDVGTGHVEHRLLLHGVAPEINDLGVLPGARWPRAIGFRGEEVEELVTFPC